MKLSITELENLQDKTQIIHFNEKIDGLDSDLPIEAKLTIKSPDDGFINITGNISATLNLNCNYCLKEIKENLLIDIDETFTKHRLFEEYKDEIELNQESLLEELNGSDEIDITDLIYQSVILNIPNKLVCDINCIGEENLNKYVKTKISDPRLEIFKSIKIEKDNQNGST